MGKDVIMGERLHHSVLAFTEPHMCATHTSSSRALTCLALIVHTC